MGLKKSDLHVTKSFIVNFHVNLTTSPYIFFLFKFSGVSVNTTMSAKRSTAALTASPANERCPSCDRQFGPKAFDRHVEWCKERQSRIQKSPANVLIAKERLEARIKYKVPPLKPRRALTREKYACSPDTTGASVRSVASSVSLDRRSPAGVTKTSKSVVDVKKGSVRREKSPVKKMEVETKSKR